MKLLISVIIFMGIFSACQWLVTHPEEDELAIEIGKDIVEDVYEYEIRTLSPSQPPHIGAARPCH